MSNKLTEQRYFNTAQVAKKMKATRAAVIKWCNAGKLPGAALWGRDWRIPASALVGFKKGKAGRPRLVKS